MGRGKRTDSVTPADNPGLEPAPEPLSLEDAKIALVQLTLIEDETERMLEAAAIIQEQMAAIGVAVAVVGGLAVAYWTSARYVTTDIDVLMPSSDEAHAILQELGFKRDGRVWVLENPEIVFEAPGSFPEGGDEPGNIETPSGRTLRILPAADMGLWRFREVIHWMERRRGGSADALAP